MSLLPSYETLVNAGYPYGRVGDVPMGDFRAEWMRTKPDRILYLPRSASGPDTDNVMARVFPSPVSDELIAVWTQSTVEGFGNNHIVCARSEDGVCWTPPQTLFAEGLLQKYAQISHVFPVVTARGRVYLFFILQTPNYDNGTQISGVLACVASDDGLRTFSADGVIPAPRCKYDHPDPFKDKNWVPQTVVRDRLNRPLVMCTYYSSHAQRPGGVNWVHEDARACLLRLDNIEENPAPEDIRFTFLPDREEMIGVENPYYPGMVTAEEPFAVCLPDGRLFVTLRTMQGCVYYTVSDDDGESFRAPEPLLLEDGSRARHPLAPCPVYDLGDGAYALLYHNNPGARRGVDENPPAPWPEGINMASYVRNPLYLSRGVFAPDARQPVRFSLPELLLDTGDVAVGPKETAEVSLYGCATLWRGRWILWYPDRKFYLLGKDITRFSRAGGKG